ncbi:SusD/RagB family nutrient-binding outer membrane lipoprotein [Dyadobacter sandarakinus]|uniref:SusD/RagB family nutrient-binding outer membrane lipoprotein n=1 Tax=Dyadobacter sandarakinus TaxID=2747268 RepID=A0ABX7I422_9BACT|nr:SusD/RagB family nutrient-binding outer membrane lipoprotein [Dyadobacter sandarakinus]QRR00680.1 SusD/RagB family nutrient-binding outer membrane lipoprotein [Dyadobacter sandarakinus]
MQKHIYSKSILTLVLGAALLSSCDDLGDINQDPNRPTNATTTTILLNAEKQVIDNIRNENSSLRGSQLFAQYYSQNIYSDQSRYDIPRSYSDTYWSNAYKALNNLNEIIILNANPATKDVAAAGTAGTNANQIAIARILKAYTFQNLTDVFGNIPYQSYGNPDPEFQALQQNPENLSPAYASQQKIYLDILNELKAAGDTLNKYKAATTFGNYDVIYKGKNELWAKFANSLRLRVATRIRKAAPTESNTHFEDALANGVFTSNADNAVFRYQSLAPNEAPLYRATVTANRKDFAVSHVLVDVLKGQRGTVKVQDPRLAVYATKNAAGEYAGQPYGLPVAAAGLLTATDVSLPGTAVNAANYGEVLQEYAEVAFLISEYKNWDQQEYVNGVTASLQKWAVPQADITTYVAALPKADKANVLNQKWLALYTQGDEAWAEVRRTGYPDFLVKPGEIVWKRTANGQTTDYKFEPLFGTGVPQRLYYPPKEQSVNLANYQNAVKAQGNDDITTPLWWNK